MYEFLSQNHIHAHLINKQPCPSIISLSLHALTIPGKKSWW